MTEFDLIAIIVQAGAVGISFGLIWLLNKVIRGNKETIENHLNSSNKVMKDVANSNVKVAKAIQKMSDALNGFVKNSLRK